MHSLTLGDAMQKLFPFVYLLKCSSPRWVFYQHCQQGEISLPGQISSVGSQTLSGVQKDSISTCLCNRFTAFVSVSCQVPDRKHLLAKSGIPTLVLTLLYLLCCCWPCYMKPFPLKLFFLYKTVLVGHMGLKPWHQQDDDTLLQ